MVWTSFEVVTCALGLPCVFHRWMCLVFLRGQTTPDLDKCSIFCSSLSLGYVARSNFALVLGAVGVGHSCLPYLGTLTQLV